MERGSGAKEMEEEDWKEARVLQLAPSPLRNFNSRAERSFPQRSSHSAATHPGPPLRTAPAAVAFLKGQVLRTRGRGLESCARAMPSTNGRRRKGRFDFRAIAERPAEQREKSPSQPRAQRASTRKVSASRGSKLVILFGLLPTPAPLAR